VRNDSRAGCTAAANPTRLVRRGTCGATTRRRRRARLYSEVERRRPRTDYSRAWYDHPQDQHLATADADGARGFAAMRGTFAGKVLLISEFRRGNRNNLNAPGSPGSYAYQSRLLAAHIAVYEADPRLSGMLIWVLRDLPRSTPPSRAGSIPRRAAEPTP